ncbi:MAG: alpha/beta hydrolase [Clostridia bacterium]|nr:alpha/beta hydrolase [Clostridia bacterium]
MKCETLALGEGIFANATLTTYVHDNPEDCLHVPRPAMLVLPGGGYAYCSNREAEPIALAYMQAGMNAYVLRYSCEEKALFPQPLLEASRAMKYIRDHAESDNTDPTRVFVIGFSAGGHLASALSTCWHREEIQAAAGVSGEENKPTGAILSYAVISGGVNRHQGTFCRLSGKTDPSDKDLSKYSAELNVDEHTPPCFLWHTAADPVVPVQNSLLMASALAVKKIPFELHVFPRGVHGLSLCTEETSVGNPDLIKPDVAPWLPLSITWLRSF